MIAPAPAPRRRPDFEALYRSDSDPWDVATSWYERRKTALVLACLRRERYRLAWDPACGTGELAAHLADRSDRVVATDQSVRAVELTRARGHAHRDRLTCAVSELPEVPAALAESGHAPDLVVLSEVLYYLDDPARAATYAMLDALAAPDADLVSVHWWPTPEEAAVAGAHAHRELGDALAARGWARLVTHTDEEFLVAVWSRALPERLGR